MTDPRIAALAEALDKAWRSQPWPSVNEPDFDRDLAAAILAALDGWTLVPVGSAAADVQRDYERRGRIEDAARAMRAARERKAMAGPDLTAAILAEQRLYAALEEKP